MEHSRFKRLVSGTLIVTFFAATTEGLAAQQQPAPPPPAEQQPVAPPSGGSMAEGQRDAELLAETVGTGGLKLAGVAAGLFTPFIGPGIGYFVIGPEAMRAEAVFAQHGKSPEYQLGFVDRWAKKTQAKKRKSFLIGGLVASAVVWGAIIAVVESQRNDLYGLR